MKDRRIEAGERQIVLASEKVQLQNIQTVIKFSQDTRSIVRALEEEVQRLQNMVVNMQNLYEQQKKQLAALQQQFYQAGSTSYADINQE